MKISARPDMERNVVPSLGRRRRGEIRPHVHKPIRLRCRRHRLTRVLLPLLPRPATRLSERVRDDVRSIIVTIVERLVLDVKPAIICLRREGRKACTWTAHRNRAVRLLRHQRRWCEKQRLWTRAETVVDVCHNLGAQRLLGNEVQKLQLRVHVIGDHNGFGVFHHHSHTRVPHRQRRLRRREAGAAVRDGSRLRRLCAVPERERRVLRPAAHEHRHCHGRLRSRSGEEREAKPTH
mmetsp:Transcript_20977/g.67876  ORF Transcript_20977/g.67876 Transcript_20977/m.67876 type:complete len:236 (-) Transcript_20977:12-719(-)